MGRERIPRVPFAVPVLVLFAASMAPPVAAQEKAAFEPGAAEVSDTVPLLLRERFPTPAERARWLVPTRTTEALGWLEGIEEAGLGVRVDTLTLVTGASAAGVDPTVDGPLPIVRVRFEPVGGAAARREGAPRLRVLVLAGQHGDEPAGPQAALLAIRALAAGESAALGRRAELWIVPWLDPWGLETGGRVEAPDLDRDHLRLRSPAVRALHAAADTWRPHLVIDLQERSPSPYGVQIGLPTHPNVDRTLTRFGRFLILPSVARTLAAADIGFRETVMVSGSAEEDPWLTPAPRAAGHARNAFALGGALALLVQSTSGLGIEGLERRTERHRIALEAVLRAAVEQEEALRATVEAVRRPPPAGRTPALSLRSRAVRDPAHPSLTWRVRGELGSIVTETTDRWKPAVKPTLRLPLPEGWILAPEEEALARAAIDHGAEVGRLARAAELAVQEHGPAPAGSGAADEGAGAKAAAVDGGRALRVVERRIPAGAWLIRSRQPAARLLFTLLEPWSEDGWYAGTESPWPVARLATPLTPLPGEGPAAAPAGPGDPVDASSGRTP